MRMYVAITDKNGFKLHSSSVGVEEVNFWRPSSKTSFNALHSGELLLFKLHSPDNFIAGGGFFTKFHHLPVNMAWDVFKEANGVRSLTEMRDRIGFYRGAPMGPAENPTIGCIMSAENLFPGQPNAWIPVPLISAGTSSKAEDMIQRQARVASFGKRYANASEKLLQIGLNRVLATLAVVESQGHGTPQVVLPRLGQGLFRILVTDFYDKRCAVTGERTLPALDAAHIKPYAIVQKHEVWNGLLMRSDLHRLFDGGYVTVDPSSRRLLVSRRIKDEFENGGIITS